MSSPIRSIGTLLYTTERPGRRLPKITICSASSEKVSAISELASCADNELGRENITAPARAEIGNSFMCVPEFMSLAITLYRYIGRQVYLTICFLGYD